MPKVYILLVNYNRWQDTLECLESLFKLNYQNFSIIVVDNCSQNKSFQNIVDWANGLLKPEFKSEFYIQTNIDNQLISKPVPFQSFDWPLPTVSWPCSKNEKLILIQSNKNLGFAGGNNVATKFALDQKDMDYIWYLNNDTVVDKDSLTKMIAFAQQEDVSGSKSLIGTKLLYYDTPTVLQGIGGKYSKWLGLTSHILENLPDADLALINLKQKEIDYPIGASMLVNSDFIWDVGFMSEDYFLFFEELDWAERARIKGWRIVSFLDCRIYHKESASIGSSKSFKSKLADYYNLRNRILITRKFFWGYLPIVYISFIPVLLIRLKRKQFDRIKMILKILFNFKKPFK